jgi:hypothetical protein
MIRTEISIETSSGVVTYNDVKIFKSQQDRTLWFRDKITDLSHIIPLENLRIYWEGNR